MSNFKVQNIFWNKMTPPVVNTQAKSNIVCNLFFIME